MYMLLGADGTLYKVKVTPMYDTVSYTHLDVYKRQPERLTASGVGDVLGKYNSLFDWNVGRIFTGEYYCPEIAAITREAVDETVEAIRRRADISKEEYTTKVMYVLLLSGLAMLSLIHI